MLIYAEDGRIIFKCEHCPESSLITGVKNKRQFQTALNRFYREHDWSCKARAEHIKNVREAKKAANNIIKLVSNQRRR